MIVKKPRENRWFEVLCLWGSARDQAERPCDEDSANVLAEFLRRKIVTEFANERGFPVWWLDKGGSMYANPYGCVNQARFYTIVACDVFELEEFINTCTKAKARPRVVFSWKEEAMQPTGQRRAFFWRAKDANNKLVTDYDEWVKACKLVIKQISEGAWYFGDGKA